MVSKATIVNILESHLQAEDPYVGIDGIESAAEAILAEIEGNNSEDSSSEDDSED